MWCSQVWRSLSWPPIVFWKAVTCSAIIIGKSGFRYSKHKGGQSTKAEMYYFGDILTFMNHEQALFLNLTLFLFLSLFRATMRATQTQPTSHTTAITVSRRREWIRCLFGFHLLLTKCTHIAYLLVLLEMGFESNRNTSEPLCTNSVLIVLCFTVWTEALFRRTSRDWHVPR